MTPPKKKSGKSAASQAATELSAEQVSAVIALFNNADWLGLESASRQLIKAWPEHGFGWKTLGVSLKMLKKDSEAMQAMHKAVELMPDDADTHNNLASALSEDGKFADAIPLLRQSLKRRPHHPETLTSLAMCMAATSELDEAIALYREAIALKTGNAETHYHLAHALLTKEDAKAAIEHFTTALAIRPDYPAALLGLGNAHYFQLEFDQAVDSYQKAIATRPDYADAYHNLALAFTAKHDHHAAIEQYCKALALKPDYAAAEVALAGALLKTGQLLEGWRHYEKRWDAFQNSYEGTLPRPQTALPQWRGEAVAQDAGILLFCEQGIGDSLQFARYLPMLAERFNRITLICQPEILALLRESFSRYGIDVSDTIPQDQSAWQWHCTTLSLPFAFGTTLDNLPASIPYLKAATGRVDYWRQRLKSSTAAGKPLVGLVWAGGNQLKADSKRSIEPSKLNALVSNSSVNWLSLQKADLTEKTGNPFKNGNLTDLMNEIQDFADTAALIENLDLVISVDTAVAHLAGALGKPVWLLNRFDGDWRWMLEREDSPWYPSMRLFNQHTEGDWDEVIARVTSALDSWLGIPVLTDGPSANEVNHIVNLFKAGEWETLEAASSKLCSKWPENGFAWKSLGVSLKMQHKNVEALAAMKKAVELIPQDFDVHNNLAAALREQGDAEAAIEHLRKALAIQPEYPDALNSLGISLGLRGEIDEAIALYRRTIAIKPDFHEAYFNLANILRDSGNIDEALSLYDKALKLKPDFAAVYNGMGITMMLANKPDEALKQFQRALDITPTLPEAINGMGNALRALGEVDKAIGYYQKALDIYPDFHDVYHNIAIAYTEKNELDRAITYYTKALELKPDYASAATGLGMVMLSKGDLRQGWQYYEKRWDGFLQAVRGTLQRPKTNLPQWHGEKPGKNASLLLFCEQGLGDSLQFIRYLPLLAERFSKVTVVCPDILINILRHSFQIKNVEIIDYFPDDHAPWQWHCTTLSVPLAFGTSLENIPNAVPYLKAPDNLVRYWENRLAHIKSNGKPCIGLVWSGNPYNTNIRLRNMCFSHVAPLLELEQFNWICLQKDKAEADTTHERLVNWMDEIVDFADSAALIENLDLVISVDTSVVHLTGGLGKPVWMINRFSGDWRWLIGREDSPWYPTMRIFTQKSRADWDEVIARVVADLVAKHDVPESFHHRGKKTAHKQKATTQPVVASSPMGKEISSILALFNTSDWPTLEQEAARLTERYPDDGFGFNSLGIALKMQRKHEQALPVLRRAAELLPDDFEVHNNLANALNDQHPEEAIQHYEIALKIKPDYVEAMYNLGITLRDSGHLQEAISLFRQALVIRPDYAQVHHNLGIALDACKQYEESIGCYQKALAIKPSYLEALHNLGHALYQLGRFEEALLYYNKALEIMPDFTEARWNRSLIILSLGQFEQGWPDYDLRFKRKKSGKLLSPVYPQWLGKESVVGKKLLIQFEQGFGDAFQMLRYVTLLERQGATCWIQAPKNMQSLLSRSFGKTTVVDKDEYPAGLDYRIPIMSLPLALKTWSEAAIPKQMPYLLADNSKVAIWQKKLAGNYSKNVGLVWRGNPEHQNDNNRSIELADLLLAIEPYTSIQFVSLQKDITAAELALLRGRDNLRVLDADLKNFDETAAVVANLDLVISVDTAPAHLAGAMGKPTWLLLPFRADWRWMLGREDSPWYPTMRLFRQQTIADWTTVLTGVSNTLQAWLNHEPLTHPSLPVAVPYQETVEQLLQLFSYGEAQTLVQVSLIASSQYPHDPFATNMLAISRALNSEQVTAFELMPVTKELSLPPRLLREVRAVEEAMMNFASCINEQGDFAEALHRLAATLLIKNCNDAAIHYYLRVVALRPAFIDGWLNLGTAYLRKGEPDHALKNYQQALKLRPNDAYALNGIGAALKDLNRLTEALEYFRMSMDADPKFAAAETGLGLTLLMLGQLREGWQHYETRWQGLNIGIQGDIKRPRTSLPQWKGETVAADAKLLIFCEQGLGDTLQFIRYAILAKQHFTEVTVICPPPLMAILSGSLHIHGIQVETSIPADQTSWQWHCNTLSLPLAFDTTLENIPATVPYLMAPINRIEYWGNHLNLLSPPGKPRIGLVWAANQDNVRLRSRSMGFSKIAPLIKLDEFSWVSLQKEKIEDLSQSGKLIDWMDEIEDLADTAALIENLDLVISIDTSVAHLAGALAKPVWLLTRFESDWRWMLNREDSPWYPTMRIFTQKNSGDWDELITRVAKELQSWHSQASRVTPELSGHASMAEMQAIIEPFSKQNWLELERLANDLCTRYPQDGFGFKSLGVALQMQNKNVQALDMMRKAAELMPSDADVHNNLAGILKQAGDIDSAISHFETAIKIRPDFVEAINNLGMVYYELGQPEKALAYCRKALGLNPVSATTLYNLGVASREAGRNAEAIDYYERALTSRPNDVNILWNLSLALLSSGQYERGWQKYETRFALPSKKPLAQTPYPCWLGKEKIAGKKILIQSEQGIGDAFQMLRYISLLEQQGAECWIQVFQPMRGIISRSFPKAKVIDEHTSPAGLDYRIPLMSLPLAMQTFTEASIPNKVPYLLADSARIAYWQRQLSGPTATVGLVWRGSPNNANDRQRSITIEKVLPLITAHPSIQFVSLQKHLSDTEHKKLRGLKNLRIIDSELTDFDETAAIMANLNVIISVDSAPVHLSAAMGKPTWLLLSFKFDWRWMTGRKDSPWYPTLRIFNQSKAGDWNNVISDVSTALGKQLLAHQARKR